MNEKKGREGSISEEQRIRRNLRCRAYYLQHREEIIRRAYLRRTALRELHNAKARERYWRNHEHNRERGREYYAKNREKLIAYERQKWIERGRKPRDPKKNREYQRRTVAKYRERYLKVKALRRERARHYNLSVEEFQEKVRPYLNGPCWACGALGKMYIDHDHATNKFRAVLCNLCNIGLGALRDSPSIMRKLIQIVEGTVELPLPA